MTWRVRPLQKEPKKAACFHEGLLQCIPSQVGQPCKEGDLYLQSQTKYINQNTMRTIPHIVCEISVSHNINQCLIVVHVAQIVYSYLSPSKLYVNYLRKKMILKEKLYVTLLICITGLLLFLHVSMRLKAANMHM